MQTPLNASASTAGALLSSSTFEVPQFQREYSWGDDEVGEFWSDLRSNIDSDSYFLGLVILTDEGARKHVVDGQQRILTLSLLATALFHEAKARGRLALADRIQADFLRSIDYETDATNARVVLSDEVDNTTFQAILALGTPPGELLDGSVSQRISQSYAFITDMLQRDLRSDPFKQLGKWTEFITHRLYFAVFVHPDPSTAYQVYEVINTRGRELTTADLLKNYILSQTAPGDRQNRYNQWQRLAKNFSIDGSNNFVQYIRHVVTVRCGHILPKDLFGFLAGRIRQSSKSPPNPDQLMNDLERYLSAYLQMVDPTAAGPSDTEALRIFSALNSLGVIAVRPILMAMQDLPNAIEGMRYVVKLVVRRVVVGNLGTGNVERRLGEAARSVFEIRDWRPLIDELSNLNPSRDDFETQLTKRSFNKAALTFFRRSILAKSIAPDHYGILHFVWPRQADAWPGIDEEEKSFWAATIGNTYLSELERRPRGANDWIGFKELLLPTGINGEWKDKLDAVDRWDGVEIERMGGQLASVAAGIWYP